MADRTSNTLTVVIDNVVLGGDEEARDGEVVGAIDIHPKPDTPPVTLLAADSDTHGVAIALTKPQALLLGQFLMLAANIKEPS